MHICEHPNKLIFESGHIRPTIAEILWVKEKAKSKTNLLKMYININVCINKVHNFKVEFSCEIITKFFKFGQNFTRRRITKILVYNMMLLW